MSIFDSFFDKLITTPLAASEAHFRKKIDEQFNSKKHPEISNWLKLVDSLPAISADVVDLKNSVSLGTSDELDEATVKNLEQKLQGLIPWRKGPFKLFSVDIDTEWRSDWKWDRVVPHIDSLKGKNVLDVGCGSGYHCWRMLGEGANWVLGIDPSPRFVMQFEVIKRYLPNYNAHVIPLALEHMPAHSQYFDSVFSMGVLYHRTSPIDHLKELRNALKPGGQLILETLIVDGELGYSLMPEDRYAMMRNVWFIPSVETLLMWLARCGFENAECVDLNQTRLDEQRSTAWMPRHSLKDFLDPENLDKTIEGYPAPKRAVIVCNRKGKTS